MEHDQATRMQAAERYLLGELSDAERDQFEEHFFDCRACAEEVRTGAIFEANARAVFVEQDRRPPVVGFWEWVRLRPAFSGSLASVALLLLGAGGYQVRVAQGLRTELAELRAPQAYPVVFLRGLTKGDEQLIEVSRTGLFFGLSLDLSPGQSFRQYRGEVLSESGAILFTVPLLKPRTPGDPLNLLIPTSSLEPGRRYTLVVRGLDGDSTGKPGIEIAKYPFATQRN
jgi:hypothetical protein